MHGNGKHTVAQLKVAVIDMLLFSPSPVVDIDQGIAYLVIQDVH